MASQLSNGQPPPPRPPFNTKTVEDRLVTSCYTIARCLYYPILVTIDSGDKGSNPTVREDHLNFVSVGASKTRRYVDEHREV